MTLVNTGLLGNGNLTMLYFLNCGPLQESKENAQALEIVNMGYSLRQQLDLFDENTTTKLFEFFCEMQREMSNTNTMITKTYTTAEDYEAEYKQFARLYEKDTSNRTREEYVKDHSADIDIYQKK